MKKIKKALVAISDFESGKNLIESIIGFFEDWVTEIHLLTVMDSETLEHLAIFRGKTVEEVLEISKGESENTLKKLKLAFSNTHLYITYDIKEGIVAETIIETSKIEDIDFIVVGSKRERIAKRLLKNHIRYVIELSDIPVLLFPV